MHSVAFIIVRKRVDRHAMENGIPLAPPTALFAHFLFIVKEIRSCLLVRSDF
jgi:hypothetical protein